MDLSFRKKYEAYRSILFVTTRVAKSLQKEGIVPKKGENFKSKENTLRVFTSFEGSLRWSLSQVREIHFSVAKFCFRGLNWIWYQ